MRKMRARCVEVTLKRIMTHTQTAITHALSRRAAGVLMHITSLPDGQLGPDAYRFVDMLSDMGVRIWQTLPVNMPHGDQSPYQSLSAHAGHTGMISARALQQQGWCDVDELALPFAHLMQLIMARVHTGASLAKADAEGLTWAGYGSFCQIHQAWLDDFALFVALREQYAYQSWQQWPSDYRQHQSAALQVFAAEHDDALHLIKFTQYVFFQQWQQLKTYANSHGVALFGDIPIFVAYDSADVWAHPEWFKLDDAGQMTVVAGVPPDYFSATGQRWGNPHYAWSTMQADGFSWWCHRIETQSTLFDVLRIDHFRGLEAAWEIPVSEPTAIHGAWVEAPGDALLATITQRFPQLTLVAEDLGIITPEVDALRLKYRLPGMKILQFAFGGDASNPYLPDNIDENSVAYTGTHDNDTTLGWFQTAPDHVQAHLSQYLQTDTLTMPDDLISLTLHSVAALAVIPMQDILGLDGRARMNTPGTIEGNWAWRMQWSALTADLQARFKQAVQDSGRAND